MNSTLSTTTEATQGMRRFVTEFREADGTLSHGEGVIWGDGSVALHWPKRATIIFGSESELLQTYQCGQGSALRIQYIDSEEAARHEG